MVDGGWWMVDGAAEAEAIRTSIATAIAAAVVPANHGIKIAPEN